MTDPKQLHSQWEFLWPGRLGHWMAFTRRYCNVTDTGWVSASGKAALKVWGINDDYADELRTRLASGMARVTKAEVAHLLPPFITQTIRVDRPRGFNPAELVDRFLRSDLHRVKSDEFIRLHSVNKISAVANLAIEALASNPHPIVMTYLHKTAHLITQAIQSAGHHAVAITGEMPGARRQKALSELLDTKAGVAVVCMASVKEAIDLTAFTTIYFAELYPSPGLMEQVAGRFHRLNSRLPVNVYFVIVNGSYEEKVAAKLIERMNAQGRAYAPSMTSASVADAFLDKRSDDEFVAHLNELLESV
jgi:SNF2 family DNA or RNA helicase